MPKSRNRKNQKKKSAAFVAQKKAHERKAKEEFLRNYMKLQSEQTERQKSGEDVEQHDIDIDLDIDDIETNE